MKKLLTCSAAVFLVFILAVSASAIHKEIPAESQIPDQPSMVVPAQQGEGIERGD
jgi:hypothetical protein